MPSLWGGPSTTPLSSQERALNDEDLKITFRHQEATSNKCITTSNKGITTSSFLLLVVRPGAPSSDALCS